MIPQEEPGFADDLRPKDHGQHGENAEPYEPSGDDRHKKCWNSHLKHAGREDKELERCWRRKHGGNHERHKLLFFKTVPNTLKPRFINSFEQKELTAGTAQAIRNQTSNGRSHRTSYAIQPGKVRLGVDITRYQGVQRDGDS